MFENISIALSFWSYDTIAKALHHAWCWYGPAGIKHYNLKE